MKKHYISRLIEEGEHQRQDFKFAISDAKKIARSLVAFANTDGGRLLIGVKDNGVLAGVRSEEELHMIEAAMQMYTRPKIKCKANNWIVEGKTVVEVIVEPGTNKPYSAPNEEGKWMVYLRQKDSNVLANKLLIKAWRKKRSSDGLFMTLDKEHNILIDLLNNHSQTSINRFCKAAGITPKHAEKVIVDLMVLDLVDYEVQDSKTVYTLKNQEK